MRKNGVLRQITMAVESALNWPEHKRQEARKIFEETAMTDEFAQSDLKETKHESDVV